MRTLHGWVDRGRGGPRPLAGGGARPGAGRLRFRGVGLGIAGVLFVGIAFGHFGLHVEERTREFVRELGLVLFVYSIGLQVGPGFLASLRRHGLRLNLLAASVVVLGVATALVLRFAGGIEPAALVGLLSGATTNTPSLAAAQQALKEALPDPGGPGRGGEAPRPRLRGRLPFRCTGHHPRDGGAAGRVPGLDREADDLERSRAAEAPPLARANLEVANPNLDGMALERVPLARRERESSSRGSGRTGRSRCRGRRRRFALGDVLLAVGTREELDALRVVVGKESSLDLRRMPSAITSKRLIVTRTAATGKTLAALDFARRFGVQITRVSRAEVEMSATPDFELQYGDTVIAVGEPGDIQKVAAELGDSPKSLNYPHLVPMFAGMALGIVVGSCPFSLPGVPAPVRLGLAGGPLLVAIALARIGTIGPLVWYMPISANYALRETGIVLFLAAVGLGAGDVFVETLVGGDGLYWMAWGAAITVVPLLVVAVVGRPCFASTT